MPMHSIKKYYVTRYEKTDSEKDKPLQSFRHEIQENVI